MRVVFITVSLIRIHQDYNITIITMIVVPNSKLILRNTIQKQRKGNTHVITYDNMGCLTLMFLFPFFLQDRVKLQMLSHQHGIAFVADLLDDDRGIRILVEHQKAFPIAHIKAME